jgi:MFS family permease
MERAVDRRHAVRVGGSDRCFRRRRIAGGRAAPTPSDRRRSQPRRCLPDDCRHVLRVGPRPIIPTGMVVAAAGMAWLGQLGVDATYTRDILGPIVLLGIGMGLAFSPAVATATSGVATEDAGVASAMVNTSQQIGGTVGTAALSTVFTTALARYIDHHRPPTPGVATAGAIHGYTVAFHIAGALFLAGAILTALILRSGRLQNDAGHA